MTTRSQEMRLRAASMFGMTVVVVTGVLVGLFLAGCFVAVVVELLG